MVELIFSSEVLVQNMFCLVGSDLPITIFKIDYSFTVSSINPEYWTKQTFQ